MSKYSHCHKGKVLDFKFERQTKQVCKFSIGHIFLGQIIKMPRNRWSVVNWYGTKKRSVKGLASRHDCAEFLIDIFDETQAEQHQKDDDMIVSNQATCLSCKESIWSGHRHDYVTCKCGELSVDGGQAYIKRVGNLSNYLEQSMYFNQNDMRILTLEAEASTKSGRNPYGVTLAVMRTLRDLGYKIVKS